MQNLRQEAISAYFKSLRKNAPNVVEPQVLSNAQLYQAGQILGQVRVVFAQNNQNRLIDPVNRSIRQIGEALIYSALR